MKDKEIAKVVDTIFGELEKQKQRVDRIDEGMKTLKRMTEDMDRLIATLSKPKKEFVSGVGHVRAPEWEDPEKKHPKEEKTQPLCIADLYDEWGSVNWDDYDRSQAFN